MRATYWFRTCVSVRLQEARSKPMKIANFTVQGSTRIGIVIGQQVADICAAAPELPREMVGLLTAGPAALERAAKAAQSAPRFELSQVKLEPPIPHPPEFLRSEERRVGKECRSRWSRCQ